MLEIDRLDKMLKAAGIPFRRIDENFRSLTPNYYKHQIIYPKVYALPLRVCSVVQGTYTYGGEENLLEIMGLLTEAEARRDGVCGYLTAEDVFERIKAHWEKKMNKIKEWTNDFTAECDKFLANGHELGLAYGCGTYLFGYEKGVAINENNYISFRVPGATRGGIKIVDNIIVDVVFDEEMCFGVIACYKKEIEPYIKAKFIGTKFDLPIVEFPKEKK